MTKLVLVCSWSGKSWGFPKGKIDENELPLKCAIRETYEETGFDCTDYTNEEDFITVITYLLYSLTYLLTHLLTLFSRLSKMRRSIHCILHRMYLKIVILNHKRGKRLVKLSFYLLIIFLNQLMVPTYLLTHSLTYLLTYSLTHLLTHSHRCAPFYT